MSLPDFPRTVEFGDIVKGLPVPDASAKAIYCSHVLEHLALTDFRRALRNTFRHLAPGGIFRCVLPDLHSLASAYLIANDPRASLEFMRRSHLGEEERARTLPQILRGIFGNSQHRWLWDYPSLAAELADAGFENIRRAALGDSNEARFRDVEEERRWVERGFLDVGEIRCLGVECTRPLSTASQHAEYLAPPSATASRGSEK
jgi:predicted SAM-dependent methyltransferase